MGHHIGCAARQVGIFQRNDTVDCIILIASKISYIIVSLEDRDACAYGCFCKTRFFDPSMITALTKLCVAKNGYHFNAS